MAESGFELDGTTYAWPQAFRLCDPVLVREVTGLSWADFTEMLDDGDPSTLAGMVAVAVWQHHPTWRREKVVRFCEAVDLAAIEFANDDDEEGEPAGPPAVGGAGPVSAAASTPESEPSEPSDEPTRASTGRRPSPTTAT